MKMPVISVLMSVYNGGKHLPKAIESILRQTFQDFELLILDDGSTDRTWDVLQHYHQRDSRIVLIRNERNLGLVESLNKGLVLARGELIARQDADDISLPERFEKQVQFMQAHPDIGVLGTGVEEVNDEGKPVRIYCFPKNHETLCSKLYLNSCFRHTTVMMRTQLLREAGGYDPRFAWAEDYDLWIRLSQRTRIANLEEVLVRYRRGVSFFTNLHRREQMEVAFEISASYVSRKITKGHLDWNSYRRFWWSIEHQFDFSIVHRSRLTVGDIYNLGPFWEMLGESRSDAQIWSLTLFRFSLSLVASGLWLSGFKMMGIACQLLRVYFHVSGVQEFVSASQYHLRIKYHRS